MASCNLINRVYYGMAVGAGIEEIRSNLLSEGEKEYDIWLAYKAAEVIFEQDVAIEEGIPLSVSQKIIRYEEEVTNDWNLRDPR